MKKITPVLLVLTILASLAACGREPSQTTEAETTAEPVTTTQPVTTTVPDEPVTPSMGLETPDGMENADVTDPSTLLPLLPSMTVAWQSEREEYDSLAKIDAENGIAYFRSGYLDHYLFYFDENGEYTLFYAYWPQVMPEEWKLATDTVTRIDALMSVNEVLRILYPSDMLSLRGEISYATAADVSVGNFGLCDAYRVTCNGKEDCTILLDKKTGLLVRCVTDGTVKQELLQIEFQTPELPPMPVTETDENP